MIDNTPVNTIYIEAARIRDDVVMRLCVVRNMRGDLLAWSSGWEPLSWVSRLALGMRYSMPAFGVYRFEWGMN